ncbi:MAG: DUF4402 domain-containing protein [Pacificimonas sp.]|nr:DUF4402 domain-containing protein [Pacificimonas sp.]
MKHILAAAVGAAAFLSAPAMAQNNTDSETINSTATILAPIDISVAGTLDFGTFTAPTASGTVSLTAAGVRTLPTGSVGVAAAAVPTATVTGTGTATYTLALGSLTLTNGSENLAVTLSHNSTETLTAGSEAFQIGGSFTANPTSAGDYTGSFTATVTYN